MMGDREYLKRLWAIFLGSILASVLLAVAFYKFGLMDKLTEFMGDNIVFTMLIIVPTIINSSVNVIFGFGIVGYPSLLDGILYNRILGFLPIYNAAKLGDAYYSSEEVGVLGRIPVIIETIMVMYYIIGLIYLFFKDGFYIISPKIIVFSAILYILFFINIWIKSIVLGKVASSFDDVVPFKGTEKYYLIPLVLGALIIFYYILIPILSLMKLSGGNFLKSTLVNTLTILIPLGLPIYTMIVSRRVISYANAYYLRNSQ